jgi:uncharacterized membrane protein YtjA (UPF0391 family)
MDGETSGLTSGVFCNRRAVGRTRAERDSGRVPGQDLHRPAECAFYKSPLAWNGVSACSVLAALRAPARRLLLGSRERRFVMLSWALTFLVIALIAALFGFTGIAGAASQIAQVLFFVFLVLMIVAGVSAAVRGRPPV